MYNAKNVMPNAFDLLMIKNSQGEFRETVNLGFKPLGSSF